MNIEHLRKQAKNLKSLYPVLVVETGGTLTLTQAQEAIAQIHGYPSWKVALRQAIDTPAAPAPTLVKSVAAIAPVVDTAQSNTLLDSTGLVEAITRGLRFEAEGVERLLVIEFDGNGEPKRKAKGCEYELRFLDPKNAAKAVRLDRKLDALVEQSQAGMTGDFATMTLAEQSRLLTAALEAVRQAPCYLDGWNRAAGVLFTRRRFQEGLALIDPVAKAVLSLLPERNHVVHVVYHLLEHRPFYRLLHTYLLLLDACGFDVDSDRLADRLYKLWPMDNMGFRFLLTRQARRGRNTRR